MVKKQMLLVVATALLGADGGAFRRVFRIDSRTFWFPLVGVAIVCTCALPGVTRADPISIPRQQISYTYPLDFGAPGPGQGDSAQPRSDVHVNNGDPGDKLTDGMFGGTWNGTAEPVVGLNEYHGHNAGTDTGTPQPRLEFDLGGTYDLDSIEIHYYTGGLGALAGPELLEITFSTDGGVSYGAMPQVSYAGFDTTDTAGAAYYAVDTVATLAGGVTDVRMDFYQGNWSVAPGTSKWVFLQEVSFYAVPEPSTALLIGLGLTGLAAKGRRRNRS